MISLTISKVSGSLAMLCVYVWSKGKDVFYHQSAHVALNSIANFQEYSTMELRLVFAFCFALLISSFSFAENSSDLSGSFSLDNGMKVIVVHDDQSPVIALAIFYRAGSIDEVNGVTGIAHACEHMMFRGTTTYPGQQFINKLKMIGALYNAGTDRDLTVYYEKVNHSDLGYVLSLEADRMRNAILSKDDFDRERQIVIEERRLRLEDNPKALLDVQLNATAFVTSPYHNPVIGWRADLYEMTIDDIRQWYSTWYAPNNSILVLVGDITLQDARALVSSYFSGIKHTELPVRRSRPEIQQSGARYFVLDLPTTFHMMSMAWVVPVWTVGVPVTDPVALQVLGYILGGYPGARLNTLLIKKKKLLESLSVDYVPIGRGPGLFKISLVAKEGSQMALIRKLVLSVIRDIQTNGPTDKEISSAKRSLYAEYVFDQDSLSNRAFDIGYFAISGRDLAARDEFYNSFQNVKKEDVQRLAVKFFKRSLMVCGELRPSMNPDLVKQNNVDTKGELPTNFSETVVST